MNAPREADEALISRFRTCVKGSGHSKTIILVASQWRKIAHPCGNWARKQQVLPARHRALRLTAGARLLPLAGRPLSEDVRSPMTVTPRPFFAACLVALAM